MMPLQTFQELNLDSEESKNWRVFEDGPLSFLLHACYDMLSRLYEDGQLELHEHCDDDGCV